MLKFWNSSFLNFFANGNEEEKKITFPQKKEIETVPAELPSWVIDLMGRKDDLLFYYGELNDGAFITPAYTLEKQTLWKDLEHNLPVLCKGVFRHPILAKRAKVKGYICKMKEGALGDLDTVLDCGVLYDRRKTNLIIPYLDFEGNPVKITAWTYIGTDELKENIEWDMTFYRSSNGRNYALAPRFDNNKQAYIGEHYSIK